MTGGTATELRASPVHVPGSAARWTTSNVDEGLPGTLTPLTWSFYFPPVELACRLGWYRLGAMSGRERPIPDDVDGRFFTAVLGHPATNLNAFGGMADRMPGGSAAAFEEQLFGSTAGPESDGVSRRRYPVVAARAPVALWRSMRTIGPLASGVEDWRRRSVSRADSLGEGAIGLLAEARDRFTEILNTHMVLTIACQGLLDRVAKLASGAGLPGLERELMKSPEGTAEFELVADLREFADGVLVLDDFLARHGYHGPKEGLLDAVVWREDPAPVLALAETYRERELGESTGQLLARRRAEQAKAMRRLEDSLGPVRSIPARRLVRFACNGPEWRETGRATILRAVDVGRAAARAAGAALAARGALDDPEDVFLFTVDELVAGLPEDPRDLAAERRADHERFAATVLPHIWRGDPEPIEIAAAAPTAETVEGLGVSSGVGEGTVRIVHDQREAELAEGDVLVCHITDPSWASLFPLATAVVTDVGSAMSHAAIVCRELGIPCVANTRDGTSRLPDGARVRVDGDAGTVQVMTQGGESR